MPERPALLVQGTGQACLRHPISRPRHSPRTNSACCASWHRSKRARRGAVVGRAGEAAHLSPFHFPSASFTDPWVNHRRSSCGASARARGATGCATATNPCGRSPLAGYSTAPFTRAFRSMFDRTPSISARLARVEQGATVVRWRCWVHRPSRRAARLRTDARAERTIQEALPGCAVPTCVDAHRVLATAARARADRRLRRACAFAGRSRVSTSPFSCACCTMTTR